MYVSVQCVGVDGGAAQDLPNLRVYAGDVRHEHERVHARSVHGCIAFGASLVIAYINHGINDNHGTGCCHRQ